MAHWRLALPLLFGLISTLPAASAQTLDPRFQSVDARMQQMVTERRLPGAALILVRDSEVLVERYYGSYSPTTRVPIASASKWLSGAVLMSLIDSGEVTLDDPIARLMPDAPADKRAITLRQLFSHTSGIPSGAGLLPQTNACLNARATTLDACARAILGVALGDPPGARFDYGGSSMQVAGRLAELASGKTWDALFRERIATPLGLTASDYAGGSQTPGYVATTNPQIGGGVRATARDYARFLRMIGHRGVLDGRRVLSQASVDAIERDQTLGAPVRGGSFAPYRLGYGIGVWRNRVDAAGNAVQVSSQGAFGASPWIDRETGLVGIVLVLTSLEDVFFDVIDIWADARRIALTLPPAGYALNVEAGYGSGRFPAGLTRDIFAEADTPTRQFVAWRGDTAVLDDPRAAHARVIQMPDRAVSISAEYRNVAAMTTRTTMVNGVRAEYAAPPGPKGAIVMFHGTGGSSRSAFLGESLAFAECAYANGYAVVALDSSNRIEAQWSPAFALTNPDVVNVEALLGRLAADGVLASSVPRFAFGVSNGGGFASRISALLGWRAQNLVIATGIEAIVSAAAVPTIWSLTRRDAVLPSDAIARAAQMAAGLTTRRIANAVEVLEPSPLYPERFARVRGLTVADSRAISTAFADAGLIGADGMLRADPRGEAAAYSAALPPAYRAFGNAIGGQLELAWAGHEAMSDFRERVIHFFDAALAPNYTGLWGDDREQGWGISIVDQGGILGPIWYTYEADGRPGWLLVSGARPAADGAFEGPVFRFRGTPFDRINGPASEPGVNVGSARFRPLDAERLEFRFTVDGAARTRVLTRYGSGMPPLCRFVGGDRRAAANRTDTWAAPGEDGWGVHLTEFRSGLLFAVWYTYAADRRALWMTSLLTRQPDGGFIGPVFRAASGVPFDRIDGPATSFPIPRVGDAWLRFSDGENARFDYALDGASVSKPLVRVRFAPDPVSECQ